MWGYLPSFLFLFVVFRTFIAAVFTCVFFWGVGRRKKKKDEETVFCYFCCCCCLCYFPLPLLLDLLFFFACLRVLWLERDCERLIILYELVWSSDYYGLCLFFCVCVMPPRMRDCAMLFVGILCENR